MSEQPITPSPTSDLTGKVALITGRIARHRRSHCQSLCCSWSQHVVLASRKQDGLDAVATQIKEAGGDALPIAAHTGSADAVQELIARATDTFGGIDIVVNNAATNPHFGPIMTSEESHWDKILDVNVKGYFRVAKACAENMKARGGGKIINVASVAGRSPQPGMGIYCVSKAAVIMLTEVLAVELAPDNIQVNAIAPGFIKTAFSQAIWDNPQINAMVVAEIPQKRIALPEELTSTALYLASPASSFTTGATIVVDGGQLLA